MKIKVNKKVAYGVMAVVIAGMIAAGIYLFFQSIHMPTFMTYPYEVTIERGNVSINSYLSDKVKIKIPKRILGCKVTYIGYKAFFEIGEEAIISDIPNDIHVECVYHQESQSYYEIYNNEARMIGYHGNEKKVEIPETVWGYEVTALIGYGFGESDVEEVVIPESVTVIENGFWECKNLKQIHLPSKLEKIDGGAFSNSGLESIELPETVKSIGPWAFGHTNIDRIDGLENLEFIGHCAFRGTPLEESIEGDFVCIGDSLHLYRGKDTEVLIPSNVKEISGAFYIIEDYPDTNPTKVEKVVVSDSVTHISAYSFDGQEGVEVYIPETVTSLGYYDDYNDQYQDSIFDLRGEGGTIVTTEGSPAEAYAIEQKIAYRIITKEEMQQEIDRLAKKQENQ